MGRVGLVSGSGCWGGLGSVLSWTQLWAGLGAVEEISTGL